MHWIDGQVKNETIEAKRNGKAFEEVNRIFDDYRFPVSGEKGGEDAGEVEEEVEKQADADAEEKIEEVPIEMEVDE